MNATTDTTVDTTMDATMNNGAPATQFARLPGGKTLLYFITPGQFESFMQNCISLAKRKGLRPPTRGEVNAEFRMLMVALAGDWQEPYEYMYQGGGIFNREAVKLYIDCMLKLALAGVSTIQWIKSRPMLTLSTDVVLQGRLQVGGGC